MDIRDNLKKIIAQAAGVAIEQVKLEHPEQEEFGDYSTNIAMIAKKSAQEIADNIKDEAIDKVEVKGPGFINITLKKEYLIGRLGEVTEFKKTKQKVMIEYTDPNPFKELHIGHLYSNTVGEVLSRLFEVQGAEVKRVCYQGDVGMHVAKAIWGMQRLGQEKISVKSLGLAYMTGAKAFEENNEANAEIINLNKKIYTQGDAEINQLYKMGKDVSLIYFDSIYKRLGTKFDYFYFESEAGKDGLKIVEDGLKKEIFEKSDGAVVFKGEKYGLHTRVFINSQGLPTYEAKELGLAPKKFKDFPYDLSVIVTANEVDEYFRVLLRCLDILYPELAKRTKHVSHGIVKLPGMEKMSSRKGNILTAEWLLDEAKNKVLQIAPESIDADAVGVAAVKYALLKSGLGRDIEFDLDQSVSFEGNSGPYLQYTYARTQSVLRKSKNLTSNPSPESGEGNERGEVNPEELSILRWVYRWPEIIEEAASRYSPNIVCTFLYELAARFNTFYNQHSILSADNFEAREFRLVLTDTVGRVLKSGLEVLGIKALEKM